MGERTYDASSIGQQLSQLPGWRFENGVISRAYKTDGWATTLMLVNAIGYFAEAGDHHPDLVVSWGQVKVSLSTHSAGGVTDKDLALARQIDHVALWRPPRGGPLKGITRDWIRGTDEG